MTNEPDFRKMSEKECFKQYGFSKEDLEKLYNNGKPLIKYNDLNSEEKE